MTHAAGGRFFYYVRPLEGGEWEVAFGPAGTTLHFTTEEAAVATARDAARAHWEREQEPSAVYAIIPGQGRYMLDYFGR